jgi:hypothetical protein
MKASSNQIRKSNIFIPNSSPPNHSKVPMLAIQSNEQKFEKQKDLLFSNQNQNQKKRELNSITSTSGNNKSIKENPGPSQKLQKPIILDSIIFENENSNQNTTDATNKPHHSKQSQIQSFDQLQLNSTNLNNGKKQKQQNNIISLVDDSNESKQPSLFPLPIPTSSPVFQSNHEQNTSHSSEQKEQNLQQPSSTFQPSFNPHSQIPQPIISKWTLCFSTSTRNMILEESKLSDKIIPIEFRLK